MEIFNLEIEGGIIIYGSNYIIIIINIIKWDVIIIVKSLIYFYIILELFILGKINFY